MRWIIYQHAAHIPILWTTAIDRKLQAKKQTFRTQETKLWRSRRWHLSICTRWPQGPLQGWCFYHLSFGQHSLAYLVIVFWGFVDIVVMPVLCDHIFRKLSNQSRNSIFSTSSSIIFFETAILTRSQSYFFAANIRPVKQVSSNIFAAVRDNFLVCFTLDKIFSHRL